MSAFMKRLEAIEAALSGADDARGLVLFTDEAGLLRRDMPGPDTPGRDQLPGEDRAAYLAEMDATARTVICVKFVKAPKPEGGQA